MKSKKNIETNKTICHYGFGIPVDIYEILCWGKGLVCFLMKETQHTKFSSCLSAKQPLFCSFDFVWFLSTTIVQGVLVALFKNFAIPHFLQQFLLLSGGS